MPGREDLHRLVRDVTKNKELASKFASLGNDVKAFVAAAKGHGYHFSEDDVKAHAAEKAASIKQQTIATAVTTATAVEVTVIDGGVTVMVYPTAIVGPTVIFGQTVQTVEVATGSQGSTTKETSMSDLDRLISDAKKDSKIRGHFQLLGHDTGAFVTVANNLGYKITNNDVNEYLHKKTASVTKKAAGGRAADGVTNVQTAAEAVTVAVGATTTVGGAQVAVLVEGVVVLT